MDAETRPEEISSAVELADHRAGAKNFICVTTRGRNFRVFNGLGHKCQATLKVTPLRAVPIPTPCMRSYYRFSPPLSVFRRLSGPASRSGRSRSVFGNLERINPLLRFSRNRKLSPVIKRVWL
jgi:hypothetical protein